MGNSGYKMLPDSRKLSLTSAATAPSQSACTGIQKGSDLPAYSIVSTQPMLFGVYSFLNKPSLPGLSWASRRYCLCRDRSSFEIAMQQIPKKFTFERDLFWTLDSPACSCWIVSQKPNSPESPSLDCIAPLPQQPSLRPHTQHPTPVGTRLLSLSCHPPCFDPEALPLLQALCSPSFRVQCQSLLLQEICAEYSHTFSDVRALAAHALLSLH